MDIHREGVKTMHMPLPCAAFERRTGVTCSTSSYDSGRERKAMHEKASLTLSDGDRLSGGMEMHKGTNVFLSPETRKRIYAE